MAVEDIVLEFSNNFSGIMKAPNGSLVIGDDGFKPYNLLLGALGSCFYATFLSIVKKKRLSFSKADLKVSGRKREEVPTTLEEAKIELTIYGADSEEQFKKCAELGAEYCSIHETISKVANIKLELHFIK